MPRVGEVATASEVLPVHAPESLSDRAVRTGVDACTDAELLTLLGVRARRRCPGSALESLDGLVGLAYASQGTLQAAGLNRSSSLRVQAAMELSRRLSRARRRVRRRLVTPEEVVAMLGVTLVGLPEERLLLLPLDPQSRLIGEPLMVSKGDVDGCDAGPRAFFRMALGAGATSAIAVHNHPSGDVTSSAADHAVTRSLIAAGRLVEVPLVDHVVIGDGGRFTSLRRSIPSLFMQ